MTREEILAMQPGRELDVLVAEKVMGIDLAGFEWPEIFGDFAGVMVKGDEKQEVKRYSTDISAAWEVVEKMQRLHVHITVMWMDDQYCAEIIEMDPEEGYKYLGQCYDVPTAAEAICKAALIATLEVAV